MQLRLGAVMILNSLLLMLPWGAALGDEPAMHFQNETSLTLNGVSGPGANQSTLTQDNAYMNTLSLSMNSDTLYMNLGGRGTDDRTADLKNLSLTNFQLRKTMGNYVFNLGDTFETFSQYGLGSALKGASVRYRNSGKRSPELSFVAGYAYPRWDSLYGDKDVKAIRRTAYGINIKEDLSEMWTAGLHFVNTDDSGRINASDPLYDGNVYSAYWEYKPFEGLSLTGESAFSNTTESPAEGVAAQRYSGNAHKVAFAGEGGPYRLNLDYERVSPHFLSVLGASTSDRERVKAKWREKKSKDTSVTYGLLWYRDNLDNQKDYTTGHYKPEIGLVKRSLFGKKTASGDMSYKLDLAAGGGKNSTNHFLDFGYRDRFGSVEMDTKLGLASYFANEGVRKSNEYTLNASFSSRRMLGNLVWKPVIDLGTWRSMDELTDQRDRIWEVALGTGIDIPDLNIVSSLKVGKHKLLKSDGDDTGRTFARLDLNHRLKTKEGSPERSLFLRWYINDYVNTDGARSFSENSLEAGMNVRY